jgi:hypothetical protein
MRELQIQHTTEFVETCKGNWKQYIDIMNSDRILKKAKKKEANPVAGREGP